MLRVERLVARTLGDLAAWHGLRLPVRRLPLIGGVGSHPIDHRPTPAAALIPRRNPLLRQPCGNGPNAALLDGKQVKDPAHHLGFLGVNLVARLVFIEGAYGDIAIGGNSAKITL